MFQRVRFFVYPCAIAAYMSTDKTRTRVRKTADKGTDKTRTRVQKNGANGRHGCKKTALSAYIGRKTHTWVTFLSKNAEKCNRSPFILLTFGFRVL